MINIDTIKLSISLEYLYGFDASCFNAEVDTIDKDGKDGKAEIVMLKLKQEYLPNGLRSLIIRNNKHNDILLEFSSKLLEDSYHVGINRESIYYLIMQLKQKLNHIVQIDFNFISRAKVLLCHIKQDLKFDNPENVLSMLGINRGNPIYNINDYEKNKGLEIKRKVKNNNERMVIYSKEKELKNKVNANIDSYNKLMLEGTLRFEMNLRTYSAMRKAFGIPKSVKDIPLSMILEAETNPILTQFQKVFNSPALISEDTQLSNENDRKRKNTDYQNSLRLAMAKELDYNMQSIQSYLKAFFAKNRDKYYAERKIYLKICENHLKNNNVSVNVYKEIEEKLIEKNNESFFTWFDNDNYEFEEPEMPELSEVI